MGQAFMAMHPPVPPSLPLPCCTAGMNKGWAGDGDLQPSPSSGARFATYSPNPELFTLSSELVLFFYSSPGSVQLSKPPGFEHSRAGCVNISGGREAEELQRGFSALHVPVSLHSSFPRNNSSVLPSVQGAAPEQLSWALSLLYLH